MTLDGSDRREADRDRRLASRRGALAVGVAGLLAGCLVTSEEGESVPRQTENGTSGDDASGSGGEGESDGDARSGDADGDGDAGGEGGPTPEEVGPDGSGLVIADTSVLGVREGGGQTTVRARLTVENAGRFEYGTVELRVDAYSAAAGSDEREAVGFEYVTERYPADDRFDGSRPRSFTVEIAFPSSRTRVRPETDRYAVDAAVRRAEPI